LCSDKLFIYLDDALETLNTVNRPLILVVDDLPVNIQLIQNYLSGVGYDTMSANNGEEALIRVRERQPDLILLDVMMPRMDGFETCRHLKNNLTTQYIPVIMVTALNELDDKIRGIEAGADDFISKPFNRLELLARVKSLLRVKTLHDQLQVKIRQLEQMKEQLRALAVTDGLTGVYNYRYFRQYLAQEIRRAERHRLIVSLAMLDIDFFKRFNDAYGHLAGDEVLRIVARLMKGHTRAIDVVARYGGEEFAIILPETNKASARIVAEKVRRLVENFPFPQKNGKEQAHLTVSVGVATYTDDAKTADALIHAADQRLYRAKAEGRNCVVDQ
jgi:diguanylate cyclase (GGDEF)-like protein